MKEFGCFKITSDNQHIRFEKFTAGLSYRNNSRLFLLFVKVGLLLLVEALTFGCILLVRTLLLLLSCGKDVSKKNIGRDCNLFTAILIQEKLSKITKNISLKKQGNLILLHCIMCLPSICSQLILNSFCKI